MTDKPEVALSERVRPSIEAAPWACEEVKRIEAARAADKARIAELEGLLRKVHSDLLMRADVDSDGVKVVNISNGIWRKIAALAQQGKEGGE